MRKVNTQTKGNKTMYKGHVHNPVRTMEGAKLYRSGVSPGMDLAIPGTQSTT